MFSAFRRLEMKQKDAFILLVAFLLFLVGILLWWFFPQTASWKKTIENPYFATRDHQGNHYIINNGKSEVLRISKENLITADISWNNHEEDCFGEADEAAVDRDGNIYILDVLWNDTGLGLAMERVLRYTPDGKFDRVVFENDYSETMITKRHLFSLVCVNDEIRFAAVDTDGKGFSTYVLKKGQNQAEQFTSFAWESAVEIQDFALDQDRGYFVIKNGTIYSFGDAGIKVLYQVADREYMLPYSLSCQKGELYFSDICNQAVYRMRGDRAELLYGKKDFERLTSRKTEQDILETINVTGNGEAQILSVTWNSGVTEIDMESSRNVSPSVTNRYTPVSRMLFFLRYICFGVAGLTAVYYLAVLMKYLIVSRTLVKKKFTIFMILGVSISAMVVMMSMLRRFKENYVQEQISSMCTVTQIASEIMDVSALKHVTYPSDYGSTDYRKLQDCMNDLIDMTSEYSENLYCNIVKVSGDRAYALAYLDNSVGAYFPLDESEAAEAKKVYRTGEKLINDGKQDATGSYVYVKTPVKDRNGKVAGIIEIGMVSDTLSGMIDSMKTKIMVEIALMVIIAVFILNECLAFIEDRKEWIHKRKREGKNCFPVPYLRIMTFFVFAAYNMPTSFLPVYIEKFYRESFPISKELAGSLPLTVNFAMIGIISLFCTGLLRRFGFRIVMTAGALCCGMGELSMALAENYAMVLAGLIMGGMGCGLVMNGLSIIVANQNGEDQTKGFSVINGAILSGMICGTVIGATLAENLGESRMFFFSAMIWVSMLILIFVTGGVFHMSGEKGEKHTGKLAFLFSGSVLGYLLLVVIPYVIINGFTSYFLPVFGDSYGLSESQTSLLLVMNCLVGIFLSEALTNLTMKYLGRGAIYLSGALSLGAVLLFGYFQNLTMLALTLFLLGASKSFGAAGREILFCRQPVVAQYGEDEAMGYYNLADNLGESIGTMVFGGMLSIGLVTGMWIFTGISAVTLGIYTLMGKQKK